MPELNDLFQEPTNIYTDYPSEEIGEIENSDIIEKELVHGKRRLQIWKCKTESHTVYIKEPILKSEMDSRESVIQTSKAAKGCFFHPTQVEAGTGDKSRSRGQQRLDKIEEAYKIGREIRIPYPPHHFRENAVIIAAGPENTLNDLRPYHRTEKLPWRENQKDELITTLSKCLLIGDWDRSGSNILLTEDNKYTFIDAETTGRPSNFFRGASNIARVLQIWGIGEELLQIVFRRAYDIGITLQDNKDQLENEYPYLFKNLDTFERNIWHSSFRPPDTNAAGEKMDRNLTQSDHWKDIEKLVDSDS